jgi:hypothetical protein
MQADLDEWLAIYNEQRTHQGCAREKQNPAKAA